MGITISAYLSLLFLSFLSATVVPISSEVYISALIEADYDLVLIVTIATIGNSLGALTGFYLGKIGKWEWIEKYFRIKREKIEKWQSKVERSGALLSLTTWLPGIGDFIAIALGFFRYNTTKAIILITTGKLLRYVIWAAIHIYGVELIFS